MNEALIKWIRFTRIQYDFSWEEIEEELNWDEDSISGVDLNTMSESELLSIKYSIIRLIRSEKHINLGPFKDV